jgi:hypothetical protein
MAIASKLSSNFFISDILLTFPLYPTNDDIVPIGYCLPAYGRNNVTGLSGQPRKQTLEAFLIKSAKALVNVS